MLYALSFWGWLELQLHGVDDHISKSRKILTAMSKRMDRNKWIIGGIIVALVLAIVLILYFKLRHWVVLNGSNFVHLLPRVNQFFQSFPTLMFRLDPDLSFVWYEKRVFSLRRHIKHMYKCLSNQNLFKYKVCWFAFQVFW